MNAKNLLWAGFFLAAISAAYVIYRTFGATKKVVDENISKPIADLLIPVVVGERTTRVLGNVVLPTGKRIPIDGLRLMPNAEFDHGGVRYRLTKRRLDNDYDSIRIM